MTDPNRRPLSTRNSAWAQGLARALAAQKVSPNAISSVGMVFATVGALGYWAAVRWPELRWVWLLVGAAGVQLRLLCNLMDGLVAVEGGLKGRAGDLFNEAPDRYEDVVLLAAAGLAAGAPILGWVAACAAVLTAYVRAFGASLGKGQDYCGPLAKQQRMFFLTVGTVAAIFHAPALAWALWVIAVGAFVTALRRVGRLYAKLP
jgi:phosphatidylglycerophosphate synthase